MPRCVAHHARGYSGARRAVQDISEEDARAEGIEWKICRVALAQRLLSALERINAARGYGWDTNPWVWVLTLQEDLGHVNYRVAAHSLPPPIAALLIAAAGGRCAAAGAGRCCLTWCCWRCTSRSRARACWRSARWSSLRWVPPFAAQVAQALRVPGVGRDNVAAGGAVRAAGPAGVREPPARPSAATGATTRLQAPAPAQAAPARPQALPLTELLLCVNARPDEVPHLAIVGPSGGGKTTLAMAILASRPGRILVLTAKEDDTWGGLPTSASTTTRPTRARGGHSTLTEEVKARLIRTKHRQEPGAWLTVVLDDYSTLQSRVPRCAAGGQADRAPRPVAARAADDAERLGAGQGARPGGRGRDAATLPLCGWSAATPRRWSWPASCGPSTCAGSTWCRPISAAGPGARGRARRQPRPTRPASSGSRCTREWQAAGIKTRRDQGARHPQRLGRRRRQRQSGPRPVCLYHRRLVGGSDRQTDAQTIPISSNQQQGEKTP